MASLGLHFTAADDYLHAVSDNFYESETYWFSFFVPERNIGAWIYTSVRQNAGVTAGGLWMWDDTATNPWDIPFYEHFSALKLPKTVDKTVRSPTGSSVSVVEPGMVYDLHYEDRDRITVDLTFRGLEEPVPLRQGAPPYPAASHYDQTGHVTGTVVLDGERIDVDCFAMRDRSWGPRTERGYRRVGYTWLASPGCSLLTYSSPTPTTDDIHSGYLRTGADLRPVASGHRKVTRDPSHAWVDALDITVVDEHGTEFTATGTARSRFILSNATSVCVNTLLEFDVDGETVFGEDQDVWPIKDFRQARRG
ncbi:MAG: hypothetical protein WAW17_31310 [Rhodococcus sp. (in: high G+C Gram-positive bacteria)]|uniref:DUF7065 domain-containing protein n=1 Tax=Rhodococcus sp. TaxID=1831 RepID=UPI003BB1ECC8